MAMQAQQVQDLGRVEVRTRFGTLPVTQENLLNFPEGLVGFEQLHQFILVHDQDNNSVFYLQSTEDPDIRFPLTSPHWFRVDYEIALSSEELDILQLTDPDDAAVLVTIANDGTQPDGIHANFSGPIILNTSHRIGLQKPISNPESSLLIKSQ